MSHLKHQGPQESHGDHSPISLSLLRPRLPHENLAHRSILKTAVSPFPPGSPHSALLFPSFQTPYHILTQFPELPVRVFHLSNLVHWDLDSEALGQGLDSVYTAGSQGLLMLLVLASDFEQQGSNSLYK